MTTLSPDRGRRPLILAIASLPVLIAASAQAAPADSPASQPRGPVEIVTVPVPLPLPGQLKPIGPPRSAAAPTDPRDGVVRANAIARVQPQRAGWLNAIQQYPYADGALYQLYAAPGQVTDIALQEGEELVGPGPVAAGDTVRWIIGDTVSGTGATKRVHILVKPTRADLVTNLVINTARRTYHLEMRATPATYMAAVSWTYPHDELIAVRAATAEAARAAPIAGGLDPATLNFRYRIGGDKVPWRPVRAFDDGRQAFIEFPDLTSVTDMPPLFVLGADGKAELVNYRVQGRYMVVDRLFGTAELRLGTGKGELRVRIVRDEGGRRPRGRP
ncbi:P-type conjugative transfer protein TrbG [Sphingomonas sp. MMSM20]|uniref:P-type conjugative transfer protein TrbG n=1 Tax=Sphingomonas lycopersici TaxID=2951807 RepID=UPI00223728AC|nr:P-type conjugative transfer protein TrbG [Sphingomonas lycopersici]MCW6530727.1 P-type conjugative transfer protein TrbG [Sphingomonas lycopersici]